jgi:hypothetical protein
MLHFALMLALGCLGFAMKSNAAAGWAVAVLINVAISTQSFGELLEEKTSAKMTSTITDAPTTRFEQRRVERLMP